jgi:hypothetical protein
VLTPDGRFVLFASMANNLVADSSGNPLPLIIFPKLNVYLRDRANGTTRLVSVNMGGTGGGNGDSWPTGLSSDGRFVLFESNASDLAPGDTNGVTDVFLRDVTSNLTTAVSVSTNAGFGNGACRGSVMTGDGRYVGFVSEASNLVDGDTNGIADVFVRDLQGRVTTLASVGALAAPIPSGWPISTSSSESPEITPDGRYVAFYSTASNLVAGSQTPGDIYVRDLLAGVTTWASSAARSAAQSAFGATNALAYNHAISADGQFVAYEARPMLASGSLGTGMVLRYNLTTGLTDVVSTNTHAATAAYEDIKDLNMTPDGRFIAFVAIAPTTTNTYVQVWDAQTGGLVLASGDLTNAIPTGSICEYPVLDASGRYVAFLSNGRNLTTNRLIGDFHLYVRDQQAGTTTLVDADTNGVGSGVSAATAPMVTSDGRLVAFTAPDGNLVSDDHNRGYDTFIRDWAAGTTELVSVRQPTFDSLTPNGPSTVSMFSVSQGARYVAFSSEADNLVANDTNGWGDVFVRDVLLGTNILVSAATNGAGSDGPSFEPAISADGSFVAFTSSADNLVPGDLNKSQDVFVRALQTGATSLVSVSTNGVSGGTNSHQPWLSADGRFVLFRSAAVNLAPGTAAIDNLFLRDLQIGATYALTTAGVECAAMTPDGRYVVFYGGLSATFRLYVWDAQARQRVYTNTASGILNVAVSPGGKVLAYATASQLSAVNWATNASWSIVPYKTYSFHLGLRFSADERWLAYATADGSVTNPLSNVYLYDLQARTNLLISQSYRFPRTPSGASDSPDMSSDGRYVAYRSAASDIVPGDGNGVPDLYVYDRLSGTTSLISIGRSGNSSADNRSLAPVFSGDAQSLVFQSWASDLVPQDFNSSSDVFVFGLNSPGSLSPFQIQALPGTAPGLNPILTWPASAGRGYRGQYKDRLDESSWHDLNGGVTVVGNQGYLNDASSGGAQRYYRVVAF